MRWFNFKKLSFWRRDTRATQPSSMTPKGMITDLRLFRNRERELSTIFQGLKHPHGPLSFSILGDRQSGKSSLLYHIYQTGTRELGPNYVFFFIDLQRIGSEEDFFRYLCELMEIEAEPESRPIWIADRSIDAFQESNRKLVLCIDEFDKAIRFGSDFFDWLRAISQLPHVALIIASRSRVSEIEPPHPYSSPLYNILHVLHLKPLDSEESSRPDGQSPS